MKRIFSNIREFFSKITWVIRRKYNQLKGIIVSFFSKVFRKVLRKSQREAKKQIQQDFFKDYILLEDYNLDLRLDVDTDKLRVKMNQQKKESRTLLKDLRKTLNDLKLSDSNRYELILKQYDSEQQRVEKVYTDRYDLALQMYDKLAELEHDNDKAIRDIENKRNFTVDEIDELRDSKSIELNVIRTTYNKETKDIFLKNPQAENLDEIALHLIKLLHLKKAYKGLPESRKRIEAKDTTKRHAKSLLQALIYLIPALLFLAVFTFYPIFNAFRLVVYENYNDATMTYSGFTLFGNFKKVLSDPNFIVPGKYVKSSAMINTLLIVIITVPVSIVISLLISVLLNSIKKISTVFQTIFFLPYVTNSLAVGLVFAYMFQTNGLFNKFLSVFNIDGGSWIQHGAPYWKAMFVLLLFSIWNGLAFKIMVFLSAIQGIDEQYYQAASIDATPRFKQFRRITAPLISPTILYIVITSVIGAFKTYSSVIAIFTNSGRPAGAPYHLKTIVFYIYDYFEHSGKMPEAAAASIVLFGIILVMTLIQMQVSKKRVHY